MGDLVQAFMPIMQTSPTKSRSKKWNNHFKRRNKREKEKLKKDLLHTIWSKEY